MKTSLIFLFICALLNNPVMAKGLMPRPDTIKLTQPDAAAPVQPDSTRPTEPALTITGNLELTRGYYAMRNAETSPIQQFSWNLSGTLILTTRTGWTIPVQGVWSTSGSEYAQAYRAIGVSPRYKNWLILHGGYRNVEFSPLTLAGHTFLGAGIEMNPGLLRIGLIAGRFNRAVETNNTDPDQIAAFRRMGYCAKIGIGNEYTYLDVLLLHVADDATSIRADSAASLAPAENAVLGLSGRIKIGQKLTAELDAAGSAYTSDTRAEPLPTTSTIMGKLIAIRPATSIRTALQASFSYRTKWADLKLRYKRIEPGYQSMGAYYLQTDLESFTVAPSLKLFRKQLTIRSSIGWQHDNLMNQKKKRTDRLIGSVSASYALPKDLTLDLVYSNYGITQRAGYRPLNDTARISQNTRTLSGSGFKRWTGNMMIHTLIGSATYQELEDMNPFTTNTTRNENWNYSCRYAWQHLPANVELTVGYNYSRTEGVDRRSLYYGPSLELEKRMLKNKLGVRLNVSLLKSNTVLAEFNEISSIRSTGLGIDYQLTPAHRLSANWTSVLNQGGQSTRQQQGSVQYAVFF